MIAKRIALKNTAVIPASYTVIPAQAGISRTQSQQIPAYAGMTTFNNQA